MGDGTVGADPGEGGAMAVYAQKRKNPTFSLVMLIVLLATLGFISLYGMIYFM